nr:MAG TPA: hypothetical protein [Caudoviricetes sp.]
MRKQVVFYSKSVCFMKTFIFEKGVNSRSSQAWKAL